MTDSSRIDLLQGQVTELRVANASLATSLEHLAASVTKLDTTVTGLVATMNQSKGALWVIVGVSSVAGGILATVISSFFGKGS